MDDGGFQLNIASSGGAAAAKKKKATSFRAKSRKAKQQKQKAKQQAPASSRNGGSGKKVTAETAARPLATRPPQSQPAQQQERRSKVINVGKERKAPVAKHKEDERKDAPIAISKTTEIPATTAVTSDESDDELTSDMPVPSVSKSIETDQAKKTPLVVKPATPAPASTPEVVKPASNGEDADGAATKKAFGTRKNPNKAAYEPEKFTTVRTAIDNVLDKPLESTSSEKIFAHTTFETMNMHPRLVDVLQKDSSAGGFAFARPTNVQVKTIPHVLAGRDVLVKSETGSGKTLSYLLPIVQKLQSVEPRLTRDDGCLALILAPTRELCLQIQETAIKLTKAFVFLVPGVVVGGEKKKSEKARLRKGISILIATPGRLADHLVNTQSFTYSRLQFLVLDEADRLLDMGFQKQITQILEIIDATTKRNPFTGGRRQNLLVSATINSGVQELAKMSLNEPVLVDADKDSQQQQQQPNKSSDGAARETFSTPHQLTQHFMIVPAKTRLCALSCFLRQELTTRKACKVVVFMSTCDAVDFHFGLFQKCAWPSRNGSNDAATGEATATTGKTGAASPLLGASGQLFRLHGNIPQQERMSTFKNFCATSSGVLICTDVAARGLNLPTVQWIVQYDPPTETRDYVHRVGRTARSGNQGSSLLFLLPSESAYLEYLQKHNLTLNALSLEKTITRVATSRDANGGRPAFMASRKKLMHEVVQSDLQYLFEETLLGDKELFELACQGFHSFVRSYATHSADTRQIFHVRGLHFGHIAKSFALREPPASTKVRDSGKSAKKGTLSKRKEREEKEQQRNAKREKVARQEKRKFAQQVSEFAD
ncbi:hypothetical protein ATCC90586_008875 [Pythium insidiosum]|nr:hypothetical protein ATCC90586_008875 [Pythium insidiosum]